MNTTRKVALIVVPLVVLGGCVALITWVGRPSYGVLFGNLGQEDAAAIVERLKDQRVPYRLIGGGGIIEVPEDKVYDLRLALAMEGLPQGGGIGFELFDRNSFGATEFVQRVNLQRALQGELARTVRQFPQVTSARVHLSLPERSLFVRDNAEPRAAVVLSLKPGSSLKGAQLQGIVYLVASSVQSMQPRGVSVVDTTGRVLYSPAEEGGMEGVSITSLVKLQNEVETRLETKIKSILEPLVGPDKVVARVSVNLDPRRIEQAEESYDPDKAAVRSEQRTQEKSSGAGTVATGVPGVLSNTPGQAAPTAAASVSPSKSQSQNETINYELNRTTRRIVAPMGEIRRLTVAVLVDGVEKKVTGKDGEETTEVVPRDPQEIKGYEEIVKQAVGFSPQRGDKIRVSSAPFKRAKPLEAAAVPGWQQALEYWLRSPLTRYGVVAVLSLVLLFTVIRPLIRGVVGALRDPRYPKELFSATVGELEGLEPGSLPMGGAASSTELMKMAESDPKLFAAALKDWMRHEK